MKQDDYQLRVDLYPPHAHTDVTELGEVVRIWTMDMHPRSLVADAETLE